jgi:2,3,4,5-tetrahydropyridine-2,6-dicarboxylate N-succinyltransferase
MGPVAAYGLGLATRDARSGRLLDAWFPTLGLADATGEALDRAIPGSGARSLELAAAPPSTDDPTLGVALGRVLAAAGASDVLGSTRVAVAVLVEDLAVAPHDMLEASLRLHLLSHRHVAPHGLSLEGVFGLMPNVAWTDHGPCEVDDVDALRLELAGVGERLRVTSIDRFPRMTDYVVPSGVRIGDADRVRLGAHLAAGTTVMHEGFVNFNAGTLGASMVEGRISAGVVVGDGSDIGGGASIMGTLSGGGSEVVRIGEGCLVGANAGVGISLGDGCVVEAGLYVTAGTKVTLPDGGLVRARELSGRAGLLFRRDSVSGAVQVLERAGQRADWGGLNTMLHSND